MGMYFSGDLFALKKKYLKRINIFIIHVLFDIFSDLKNDHIPEVFHLKHEIDGKLFFLVRYVKIGRDLPGFVMLSIFD